MVKYILMISIILFIIIYRKIIHNIKKKEMGDLTGVYSVKKRPDGNATSEYIKAQFIYNGKKYFRIATKQEINILKKYKYM